jgi:nitronate monooxygenase
MAFLRERLGLDLPIIQAPMAGVQGSALATAVCRARALGSVPAAMLTLDALREELATVASATDAPYNVNFFCHTVPNVDLARDAAWRARLRPYYEELGVSVPDTGAGGGRMPFTHDAADVLEEFRPAVVSFHFGLPAPDLLARVRSWGALILSSATTVDEARWLEAHGVDAVIAQGLEAGGHRGHFLSHDLSRQSGTFALLPQVVTAVRVPVIAAGGIADASGVAAALRLGADAVQIGTSYLLCHEATTSRVHRDALRVHEDREAHEDHEDISGGDRRVHAAIRLDARHTALTNVFTGRPARGIVNRLMRELGFLDTMAPEFPLAAAAILPLRAKAEADGRGDFSPMWAGQNVSGCKAVSAAEITEQLVPS